MEFLNIEIKNSHAVLPPALGASVYAIACILSYEGLFGVPIAPQPVDSFASVGNNGGISKSMPDRRGISGFLKSLMSDNSFTNNTYDFHSDARRASNGSRYGRFTASRFHKDMAVQTSNNSNFRRTAPPYQGAPPQGQSVGGFASRNRSFKRQRDGGTTDN